MKQNTASAKRLAKVKLTLTKRTVEALPSLFSKSGHVEELHGHYARIGKVSGTKFLFHGLHNVFITVAERELMLPRSLTKRLVNHARPSDVTEGYAADWTVEQLREPAQRIADRIDELGAVASRVAA